MGQWTEELREKFQIPARSTEEPAFRSKNPAAAWHAPGVLVSSLHLAKLERHARFVAEVIVRNTRAHAGLSVALPPRFARTLVVEPTLRRALVSRELDADRT